MKEQFANNLLVLDSREAILALSPLLESLALRCGQPGAMHWLSYFLDKEVLGLRLPRLVLFLRPEEGNEKSLRAESLEAAALFFEYKVLGVCTGVVATGDAVGFNGILAVAGQRSRVAAMASQALLERGASLSLATFEQEDSQPQPGPLLAEGAPTRWAVRHRQVARMLPLRPTMDETLAQMGKATRFNLRYYRRRLEKRMPCEFHADVRSLLQGTDLQELNAGSLNPVEDVEFRRRCAAASSLPGSFLCGLRAQDGRWLSLIGGWRQEGTTVLYWQMNTAGFEKHSIGTVMRSYFLENEIARGCSKLLIYGGTPHSMGHAFREDEVTDLAMERSSLRTAVLRRAARVALLTRRFGNNFVLETLSDPGLAWQTGPSRPVAVPRKPRVALKALGTQRAV